MKKLFYILILLVLVSCNKSKYFEIKTVETNEPRFSWNYVSDARNVKQTSYRIIAASTLENARDGIGDLWDSGEVFSDKTLYISYEGKTLRSRDKVFWKVFATLSYEKNKTVSIESDVKFFEISLLESSDWQAKWIGHEFEDDVLAGKTRLAARYLRKEFNLNENIVEARLYISGLGQYSAFINGSEVAADELLKPALSDYRKRVYFNTFDVTEMLKNGDNAIGVILEGGHYTAMRINPDHIDQDHTDNTLHFGTPRLLLQLEITYSNGRNELIVSDESWKITNRGPIRTSNEYDGETYDENLELGDWTLPQYDDSSWLEAETVKAPDGTLTPQLNPNIKVQDTLTPVSVFRKGEKWILDMGQNMVGVLQMNVSWQNPGDTITLRFAENLYPDSTIDVRNLRDAEATDRYIINRDGINKDGQRSVSTIVWKPMFTYHGFRYVEIQGFREIPKLSDFKGLVFYDEMSVTGTFETSDEIINAVYRNAFWGIRGNYRSMPTDCPQRDERLGWTGDRATGCYGESYIFDNHQLYAKWLDDGEDCQLENGCLCDVFPPYWRNYTNSMTWPGAFITVADMIYTRFGDDEPIRKHYQAMKKWIVFMKNRFMVDGIMKRDQYGDWCMPPESPELIHSKDKNRKTRAEVIATPYYCYLSNIMAKFAEMSDFTDDVEYFRNEVAASTEAYNAKYLNRQIWRYANNTVTANILPLYFGMVPEGREDDVFENLVERTEDMHDGHVSTGVIGIQFLMRTLTEHGRGDLALKIATNDTYPSWGYMVRNGATTIWELWNGNTADPAMNSGNHVMLLGDLIIWEYECLGGLKALEPGYKKIQLKPYPIDGLDFVNCSYESVSGRIESNWRRDGNRFEWDITIPANTEAEVWIPSKSGHKIKTLGSGRYKIRIKTQELKVLKEI
ncbi:MAG: family 78 glycoside hydrolase catalytic domain [Bacteroidia bacterium]|nr:family 78 glycoside hydrolase catalytic domain [Bacteroidia bacterium]